MNVVELYTTPDCGLCQEAKLLLLRLQKEYPFRIEEQVLHEDHPRYKEYLVSVPVVVVQHAEMLSGRVEEKKLRSAIKRHLKPSAAILASKFLEALGFITVAAGLFYGVTRNDEWAELYFFLAGIVLFAVGRLLERRELKKARI